MERKEVRERLERDVKILEKLSREYREAEDWRQWAICEDELETARYQLRQVS